MDGLTDNSPQNAWRRSNQKVAGRFKGLRKPADGGAAPDKTNVVLQTGRNELVAPRRIVTSTAGADDFALSLRGALFDIHVRSSKAAIRFPSLNGAFPPDLLLRPPPVVPDASRLRDDILYACRHSQRTVLVTAANAGLLRLFCAKHVVDEVVEHSAEWTQGSSVSQTQFLRRWLVEYLTVIRVVPDDALVGLLDPEEANRIRELSVVDPDDVPSASLALLLEAFYLSNDTDALLAVYGRDALLEEQAKWLEVLRAGGDAGELTRMFQLAGNIVGILGSGVTSALKRLVTATGPWGLVPIGILAVTLVTRASKEAKQRVKSATVSAGTFLLQTYALTRDAEAPRRRATSPASRPARRPAPPDIAAP